MKRFRSALVWGAVGFTVSAATVFACSSSSGGDDSNGSPLPDGSTDATTADVVDEAELAAEKDACTAYWTAYCQKQSTCYGYTADDTATCIQTNSAQCPAGYFGGAGASVKASDLQACVTALGTQTCADFRVGIPASPSCVVPGSRTQNEACHANAQCQSLSCINYYSGCGVCSRQFDTTEDCTESTGAYTRCAPGTFCDLYDSRHCVPYDEIGCDIGKAYNGGCPSQTACVTVGDAGTGKCVELPDPGSPCLHARPYLGDSIQPYCGAGSCSGGTADDGGTCVLPVSVGPGEDCGGLSDGGTAQCTGDSQCYPPFVGDSPKCVPNQATGAPCGDVPYTYPDGGVAGNIYKYCVTDDICSNNCLLTTDGGQAGACIASPPGDVGASCDACTRCKQGLQCIDNKCAPIDYSACQ